MSYRLIDANALAANCKQVNDMPCIYADLPNGLDGGYYDLARAERTCWYLPDEHRSVWDKGDIEWECEEAECFDDSDCSCSECGYTMMGGDDGWFDHEDTDGPNGIIEGCVPVPRFEYCPSCGAKVERPVPVWRVVEQ